MTMPVNIRTVHILNNGNTKETKGRGRQANKAIERSIQKQIGKIKAHRGSLPDSKDPLVKPTTEVQHGNQRSDSSNKPDNIHPRVKEPIRVVALNRKADANRHDQAKKVKELIAIKIADLSNRNHCRKDPIPERRQAGGHTPAGKPVLEVNRQQEEAILLQERGSRNTPLPQGTYPANNAQHFYSFIIFGIIFITEGMRKYIKFDGISN